MRLIDADALLLDWEWFDEWGNYTRAGQAVADAPTIDAVEVVRCKDCKNTITRPDGEIYCKKLDMEEIPVSHFCGWGERKGDDDDY